ncbi:pilus assembly protein TadG-related protein [Candidatus Margulisiibacteriota bacterium]
MFRSIKKGQIIVLFPILFIVILGLAGIAFDFGNALVIKNKTHAVADAAALSGARKVHLGVSEAGQAVLDFIQRNAYSEDSFYIETPYQGNSQRIKVSVAATVPYFFFRVFGRSSQGLEESSIAEGGDIVYRGCNGLVMPDSMYNPGQKYMVKVDRGEHGNCGAAVLGDGGALGFEESLTNGYQGASLGVGDTLLTEPGRMKNATSGGFHSRYNDGYPGETWDNYTPGNPRVVLVVLVNPNPYEQTGRSEVTVTGFAVFFLDRYKHHSGEIDGIYIGPAEDHYLGEGQESFGEAVLIE